MRNILTGFTFTAFIIVIGTCLYVTWNQHMASQATWERFFEPQVECFDTGGGNLYSPPTFLVDGFLWCTRKGSDESFFVIKITDERLDLIVKHEFEVVPTNNSR